MKKIYNIKGMHCESCVRTISNALKKLAVNVEVTFHPPRAILEGDSIIHDITALNAAVATAGNYELLPIENDAVTPTVSSEAITRSWFSIYYPLLLIIGMITLVSLKGGSVRVWMLDFMAGFFLVFGSFKLLDIKGFRNAYASYDLLAKYWNNYGLIYPFLELALGFAFLFQYKLFIALCFSILLMSMSSIGVIKALFEKRTIPCACLGTTLNLPMSTITLVEDLGMVMMSILMLLLS